MERTFENESRFHYSGHNCVVVKLGLESSDYHEPWRCGYVELIGYDNWITNEDEAGIIDCHGGITFYGYRERVGLIGPCIGFDCAHLDDNLEKCSVDFCVRECQRIVDQLNMISYGIEIAMGKMPEKPLKDNGLVIKETAKWIEMTDGWFNYHYCSHCGGRHFDPGNPLPKICPKCGRMIIE